jgi:hypothetical protein
MRLRSHLAFAAMNYRETTGADLTKLERDEQIS